MDPEHLQATLDLIVGQLGSVMQQIRNTQTDLADFRRHTSDRLDNIKRMRNPATTHLRDLTHLMARITDPIMTNLEIPDIFKTITDITQDPIKNP
ncbi:hypothetical protein MA16_Dca013673 [Dendrobium catenatum]|uniref:Uncharacterized protein n=1 Tax=Dendrobium catenatum TaxID=906689 RepID=A0A2I0WPF8_9ASPA|nr:hypothetical protein MA16_Dca013673 [Dendrobium catenatum]